MSQKYHRKRKLIRPALQFRITLAFMSTSVVVLSLMGCFLAWLLRGDSLHVPAGAELVVDQIMTFFMVSFAISMILIVPLTLYVGLKVTHVVAGPLYRMELYLQEVIRGERPEDMRLRKGDELQDICALINEVTRPLRERVDESEDGDDEPVESAKAA